MSLADDGLAVKFIDHVLQLPVTMDVDAFILSAGVMANDTEELASFLKVPRNAEGFFHRGPRQAAAG